MGVKDGKDKFSTKLINLMAFSLTGTRHQSSQTLVHYIHRLRRMYNRGKSLPPPSWTLFHARSELFLEIIIAGGECIIVGSPRQYRSDLGPPPYPLDVRRAGSTVALRSRSSVVSLE